MTSRFLSSWIDFIRDHTYIIILLISISLLGLIAIQSYLISAEIEVQRDRFDEEIENVLQDMNHRIEEDEALSNQLIQLFTNGVIRPAKDSLEKQLAMEIRTAGDSLLQDYGMADLEYDFAFYHRFEDTLVFSSTSTAVQPDFKRYSTKAGWRIGEALGKSMYRFGMLFHNKDEFLRYRVAATFIVSVIFISILLICFVSALLVLKRQKQLSALKNDFINNLAHELKTPIFSTSIIFKIIREKIVQSSYQDLDHHLSLLEIENQSLKQKVERVLELSIFESNNLEIKWEPVDVHEIISKKIELYSVLLTPRIGKIFYSTRATQLQIYGDPVQIGNIIDNLLDNAIKYCEVAPSISIESYNENNKLCIKFSDNGIGINSDDLAFVFDKFYRVTKGNLHQAKGFGLGLSYVKMMTELHKGKIHLESQVGKGSVFTISFPLVS